MTQVRATLLGGVIVPDKPLPLPDGTRLLVTTAATVPVQMMTEDEQGDDPESIARWIEWAEQLQPLLMTPEEEAEWQKARAEQKAWQLANWDAHCKKIEDLFK